MWFVKDEGKSRVLTRHAKARIELAPFVLDLPRPLLLHPLLLLRLDGELLKLGSVHFHVSSDDREGYCGHTLIPVLLL